MNGLPRRLSFYGLVSAAAIAALLTGCESAPPPAPPPVAAYAPPPMQLPQRVIDAAAAYETYVESASAITPDFADGAVVSQKLRVGAAYEAEQMQRGQAAYGALIALQDQAFVAALRVYTSEASSRAQIASEIMKDPAYVLAIGGANGAAVRVATALDFQGSRVKEAGEKIKQSAYDVQKMAWSKETVTGREARLAEAKALSLTPRTAGPEIAAKLQMASSGRGPVLLMGATPLNGPPQPATSPADSPSPSIDSVLSGAPAPAASAAPPYSAVVVRGLAGAALAVLGEGGEGNSDHIWAVLNDPNQGMCFNMAKLNLYQCLSVAKPYYEDVFCLGQHVLMDTGQCMIKGAGVQKAAPLVFAESATVTPYNTPAKKIPAPKTTKKR